VVRGDLLQEPVEAIVNAANGHLAHGGGVAGIIARARQRGGRRSGMSGYA
jgi:O-acetyl-ADP-ribose deacetylase